jgi:hypothetical protein
MAAIAKKEALRIAIQHAARKPLNHPDYCLRFELSGRVGDEWPFAYRIHCLKDIPKSELANRALAEKFLRNCGLVYEATSFSGLHTTAERRARWGGDKVAEGFIRLSIGCEDGQDLIADLKQALDSALRQ